MLLAESIRPLDGLHATIDASHVPSSSSFTPPAICLSQTSPPKSTNNPKWTVALGVAQAHGQSRWYEKAHTLDQVEQLAKVSGSTLTAQTVIGLIAKSWTTSGLVLNELGKSGSAVVQVTITKTLTISIRLSKVDSSTIDHLRILQKTIPLAQSATELSATNAALTKRAERAEKQLGQEVLRRQAAETSLRHAERPSMKRSASSQSSTGRLPSSQSNAFASPKKPKLKPGDSGYAGSSYRLGRVVDDPEGGFDEDPPSG